MIAFTEKEHNNSFTNIFKPLKVDLLSVTCGISRIDSGRLWYEIFTGTNQDDIPSLLVPSLVRKTRTSRWFTAGNVPFSIGKNNASGEVSVLYFLCVTLLFSAQGNWSHSDSALFLIPWCIPAPSVPGAQGNASMPIINIWKIWDPGRLNGLSNIKRLWQNWTHFFTEI